MKRRHRKNSKSSSSDSAVVNRAILFTDVSGSTERSAALETLAAKEAVQLLLYQKSQVQEDTGEFVKTMGDGIMATFDRLSIAVKAAINIQKNIPKTLSWYRNLLRIGIAYGQVRKYFSEPAHINDYAGTICALASRLCNGAKPGHILVAESTMQSEVVEWEGIRKMSQVAMLEKCQIKGVGGQSVVDILYEKTLTSQNAPSSMWLWPINEVSKFTMTTRMVQEIYESLNENRDDSKAPKTIGAFADEVRAAIKGASRIDIIAYSLTTWADRLQSIDTNGKKIRALLLEPDSYGFAEKCRLETVREMSSANISSILDAHFERTRERHIKDIVKSVDLLKRSGVEVKVTSAPIIFYGFLIDDRRWLGTFPYLNPTERIFRLPGFDITKDRPDQDGIVHAFIDQLKIWFEYRWGMAKQI